MIGDIPGFDVGAEFASRRELFDASLHKQTQAGIAGKKSTGAESIVLSGGYPDDEDHGDIVIYTGHGGQVNGKQVANQHFDGNGNAALVTSHLLGLPVRVFRGGKHKEFRPAAGYRYDGLYRVESYWREPGREGFLMCRFRLEALGDLPFRHNANGDAQPNKVTTTIQRIVRDTAMSRDIKKLHNYRCQVCDIRLECVGGPYAEGAHIRPLGSPHHGPDTKENLLCLCPNHHVLFDNGGFSIADDLSLIGLDGKLRTEKGHTPSPAHLQYHRGLWQPD